MRWHVEVTSIGKTDSQAFCVEADSWQRALQSARGMRGETGPMSGFSIELLEEGYRAVDPMARLRYVVKRAADDAPLSTGTAASTSAAAPASTGKKPAAAPASSAAAAPAAAAPAAAAPAAAAVAAAAPASSATPSTAPPRPGGPSSKKPASAPLNKTAAFGSTGAAEVATDGVSGAATPAPEVAVAPAPIAAVTTAPVVAVAAAPAPPPPPSTTDLPATQVIYKREQEPMPAAPLTYREYVYAVAQGTSEEVGAKILNAQFELIRKSLASARSGKLVNLAVFDVVFQGKPPVLPLATLTWKDWKGDPVVAYPRRTGGAPRSFPPPSQAAQSMPAPQSAPIPASKPASIPPPKPASIPPPAPQAAAPLPAPPPPGPAPTPPPAPAVSRPPSSPSFTVGGVPARKSPSSSGLRAGRLRGDELISSLFEAMHDLHFLRDSLEGGDFCLALALEKLPSQLGVVHFFDISKREFIVTCTRGGGAEKLLLRRFGESDPVLAAALRKRRAVVWSDAAVDGTSRTERFQAVGGAKSLIVAPIMQAGRALGVIELVNPTDNVPFTEEEGNAVTYIAEQFSEFISSRGLILDADRIARARSTPPPAMR